MLMRITSAIANLHFSLRRSVLLAIQATAIALLVAACGGGAETETLPQTDIPTTSGYTGPAPLTNDIQAFRIALWEQIRTPDRCGQCHSVTGGQNPMFARSDDVNEAYLEAESRIDRDVPALSRLVTKVSTGHGCWDDTTEACVDTMTRWIENWVGSSASGGRQIVLTPPVIKDPGESKNFPDSPANFGEIHDLLTTHCSECHVASAEFAQQPYFASSDINEAYAAAKTKINLDIPGNSRLVVRLFPESHNCWFNQANPSCAGDADIMRTAIENFAGSINPDVVNPDFVISKALLLNDGIVASGGDRFEDNLVALWEFKELPGTNKANDTSGVDPAIDLTLSGDADFIGGWGIRINDGKAQAATTTSQKLYNTISLTGEYAIEAWVAPANVTQEDAFIISYSGSNSDRNFTLGQTLYNYDFFNRSSNTSANGDPALSTADADEDLQATLQHVVINYDPVNGRSIYVNGQHTGDFDAPVNQGGSIGSWRNNFAFVLGNETSNERQWQGVIRMVAIHNRTLTPEQVQQNFAVGVGQKFFLLFYLGDVLTGINEPYLMFEVSQFDSYSYLFNQPRFISLDKNENPGKVNIEGISIGINGRINDIGQAFRKVSTLPASYVWNYTPDGHFLSDRGTIIAQEKGAAQDEFFLCFKTLGTESDVCGDPITIVPPAIPLPSAPAPEYGLRTFEEIHASMSSLTTVSIQESNVRNTYLLVKQQLPTVENMGGFLAAHQMAVAQLAIEYCNALVDDSSKRAAYWPGFDFSDSLTAAFGTTTGRNLALNPLVDRISPPHATTGARPSTQPTDTVIKDELNALIDELMNCRDPADPKSEAARSINHCPADRTEVIMKAVCGTAIGNATMLVQ